MIHPNLLDSHLQILLKQDRIHDVPTVKASLGHLVVVVVIIMQKGVMVGIVRIAQERRTIGVLHRTSVLLRGKAPCPAEIILRPGSAYRGILFIPVDIKLHLAFPIPVAFQRCQSHIGAHVLPASLNAVQNHIILSFFRQTRSSPAGMKIPGIFRKFIQKAIIHLIKESIYCLITLVFNGDFSLFPERHGEIAVKASGGIHRYGHGIYRIGHAEATAEKISQRAFHRRAFFPVPIHTQHKIPENIAVSVACPVSHRNPDMLYHAGTVYFGQRHGFSRLQSRNTGRAFPGRPQITGRHPSLSFFSCPVLPVNASAFSLFQQGQAAEAPIKHTLSLLKKAGKSNCPLMWLKWL